MFAFTSMGEKVDKVINNGGGPYVFRPNGHNYHRVGTLLPKEGDKPRFAQLYIYDTMNEITNRIGTLTSNERNSSLDGNIVDGLLKMLNT